MFMTEKIIKLVTDLNPSIDTKYNILLLLWKLGVDTLNDYMMNKDKPIEDTRNYYKYVFNNMVVSIIWGMVHCNDNRIKALSLTVLHFFIENYQSLQPLALENKLRFYLHNILILNDNQEVQFMTKFIAAHSYQEPIQEKVTILDAQQNTNSSIAGIKYQSGPTSKYFPG